MGNRKAVFSIAGALVLSLYAIIGNAAQNDFSGTWVLDKGKTRNLPSDLKSYTMFVTQDGQQLVVETKMESDRPSMGGEPNEGPPEGGGPPPGGPGNEGMGGPEGGGPPGGPEGGPGGGGPPGGAMTLHLVIPKATYSLDGSETTTQVEGPMAGSAKLKAKWIKDGKALELSSVQELDFREHSVTLSTKEQWTLSEDGTQLKVQRSVETPRGTETIKLTFRKGQGEPETGQQ